MRHHLLCTGGCGENVSQTGIIGLGGILCDLCAGERAMAVLDDPEASSVDKDVAERAVNLLNARRRRRRRTS